MKFIQLFTKIPNYKRFGYMPRHYDPLQEEIKEREAQIQAELAKGNKTIEEAEKELAKDLTDDGGHRTRITGSFKTAKKTVTVQKDPSASMMRLALMLIMVVALIGYLQFGSVALYGAALIIVPFYLYLKFRKIKR